MPGRERRRRYTLGALAAVVLLWLVLFVLLHGHDTLSLATADTTSLHNDINDFNSGISDTRDSNPFFVYFLNGVRTGVGQLVTFFQALVSQPALGRPLPLVGWLGVVAVGGFVSWVAGNLRVALLCVGGLVLIGLQGLWQPAMDTLALTSASVLICLVVGIPLGVWAGLDRRFERVVTPVLDFMQTMPTFVYLAPLTLFFLIGPATGTIATLIYAMPPVIRLTAHGIRSVPVETREAAESLGSTRWQVLRKVLLPMAARTVVIGVNQTIMAALSMVTIAALVAAPGLGQTVVQALESLDVGTAFNAGLAIVVLAVVLDRVTTAASVRAGAARGEGAGGPARGPAWARTRIARRALVGAGAVATLVCVYLSYTYLELARFPGGVDLGTPIVHAADSVTGWVQGNLSGATGAVKDFVSAAGIDPLQSLLDDSPWWLTCCAVAAIALLVGGAWAAVTSVVCLGLIIGSGVWQDAMDTLAATLLATVAVVVLGLVFGVWMGRSRRTDRVLRPVLDAAQVMPPFVYLVPFIALFAATRFTGVIAAVLYAAPVAIKIIADGVRGVPAETVEAALSSGSSPWQIVTKVQLPMSLRTVALAVNQGLIYVLSMVVVGGLVGGGALGYDVVAGFSQLSLFGKGLAAGVAVVLLGITLDRITQGAAGAGARVSPGSGPEGPRRGRGPRQAAPRGRTPRGSGPRQDDTTKGTACG
ncbi:ABC transporter permease [Phaeacidiphilus oryzae]|uniref:ABC transporter permease n=1 Tax=Phaeacidiphilus oryzae TaxID=348818 RepID=UPI001F1878DD|nr:ABC transporter permease subunit [Phaeacidiphilus oryzae]